VRPPPARIETARLVLRRWELSDEPAFADLLESNREHYAACIPFYLEGEPLERLRGYRDAFDGGDGFSYGGFEAGRLVGGGGLFPRVGPGALEIGYHVRWGETRRGLATEIAAALADVAFEHCGAERVELHIDPANAASLGVARTLGFAETGYDADKGVAIFSRVRSASEASVTSASESDSSSGG
jgi:RimJ/RimL family protein N-acetyltransferase